MTLTREEAVGRVRAFLLRARVIQQSLHDLANETGLSTLVETAVLGRRIKDEERRLELLLADCIDATGKVCHRPKATPTWKHDLDRASGE